jgi:regulatory protein
MSGSEEKLAPVIYLFGATAPEAQHDDPELSLTEPSEMEPSETEPSETERAVTALPAMKVAESLELAADAPKRSGKFERVNNVSLHALARKGMSSVEMTQLLESREIEPDAVAEEVERLEGVGLLDDRALAETLVRTLQDRKGLGRSAINAELRRRKIDIEAINEAMEAVDSDDELTRAIEIAQKRAAQLSSYDNETARRRLSAYLMRRGYNGSIISAAIAASLGTGGSRGGASSTPRFR